MYKPRAKVFPFFKKNQMNKGCQDQKSISISYRFFLTNFYYGKVRWAIHLYLNLSSMDYAPDISRNCQKYIEILRINRRFIYTLTYLQWTVPCTFISNSFKTKTVSFILGYDLNSDRKWDLAEEAQLALEHYDLCQSDTMASPLWPINPPTNHTRIDLISLSV